MKLDNSEKATIQEITALKVKGQHGNMMPISDVVKWSAKIWKKVFTEKTKNAWFMCLQIWQEVWKVRLMRFWEWKKN